MEQPGPASSFDAVGRFASWIADTAGPFVLLRPTQTMSFTALAIAMVIAYLFLACQHRNGWRRLGTRRMLRALFPKAYWRHRSHALDIALFLGNSYAFGVILIWTALSFHEVRSATGSRLRSQELGDGEQTVALRVAHEDRARGTNAALELDARPMLELDHVGSEHDPLFDGRADLPVGREHRPVGTPESVHAAVHDGAVVGENDHLRMKTG